MRIPRILNLLLTPPCSGHSAKKGHSDGSNEDHVSRSKGNMRPMSTMRSYRSRKQKQGRNHGTADEDIEYEVENILNACISYQKLQYCVKWLGYKHDPKWHDASNFKNSPYKLGDFHLVNPTLSRASKKAREMDTVLGGGQRCVRPS
ncbi:hypothetical protein GQ44DRAFT_768779 [Phaeosphaeriaceae sp. PMI808]|nr:hypothetical protein GQ44DRAFT_768779 [Phaeosphaeriaceae sp. PMI808]